MIKYLCYLLCAFALVLTPAFAQETPEKPLPKDVEEALNVSEQGHLPQIDQFYYEFIKMMVMLGVVIAFLLLIMWFLKRMFNTRIEQLNSTSLIKIVERRNLTPKTSLYVLEIGNKNYVIAESHNGVTLVSQTRSNQDNNLQDV